MLGFVFNVEDVIQNDIMDDDSSHDANHNEDTGFWKNLGQEIHMMEDDLEQHCRDDHPGEHDGAGELIPLPRCQMYSSMMFSISMVSLMTM